MPDLLRQLAPADHALAVRRREDASSTERRGIGFGSVRVGKVGATDANLALQPPAFIDAEITGASRILLSIAGGRDGGRVGEEEPEVQVGAGFPLDVLTSFSVVAPSGTPPAIVQRLSSEIGRAMRAPAVAEKLNGQALVPVFDTPEEFGATLKLERERWLRAFERRYLAEILERNQGNVTAAARAAGVDRIHFYRLLWRHGLR